MERSGGRTRSEQDSFRLMGWHNYHVPGADVSESGGILIFKGCPRSCMRAECRSGPYDDELCVRGRRRPYGAIGSAKEMYSALRAPVVLAVLIRIGKT